MIRIIRSILITIAFVLCVLCIEESISQNVEGRCGPWQYGPCERMHKNGGKCGRGTKKATRTGDSTKCNPLEKTVSCKVPCTGNKKVCKYRKGQWSECDAVTLKRVRTDTLIRELSDATCDASRPFEKACKRKLCEYGPWTDFGACTNDRQTRSRPILKGTQEQCGGKATKSRRCSSATKTQGRIRKGGAATGESKFLA